MEEKFVGPVKLLQDQILGVTGPKWPVTFLSLKRFFIDHKDT